MLGRAYLQHLRGRGVVVCEAGGLLASAPVPLMAFVPNAPMQSLLHYFPR